MPDRVYRGSDLLSLNMGEFDDGVVEGDRVPTFGVRSRGDLDLGEHVYTPIRDLPVDAVEQASVPITGGFTSAVTAALKFAMAMEQLQTVLVLDRSKVEGLEAIDYHIGWFDRHPGALAWVETLADADVYINERLAALAQRDEDGEYLLSRYGDAIQDRARSHVYESEREMLVFQPSVDIGAAIEAVIVYVDDSPSPADLNSTLDRHFDDISDYFHRSGTVRLHGKAVEERLEIAYDRISRVMRDHADKLYVVFLESYHDVRVDDETIDTENVVQYYDGQTHSTDPLPILLGR